jgi:uncharacterized membrane protein YhaH (DUF805 family)
VNSFGSLVSLLTSFHGRISRKPWWIGILILFIVDLCATLLVFNPEFLTDAKRPPPDWPETIWRLAWLIPLTAITVKRFNDRDWPFWLGYAVAALHTIDYVAPYFGFPINPEAPG